MTTTPTNKPVPSNDPRDLLNNAEVFDSLINDQGYFTNRKGGRLPAYITAIAELGFDAPIAFRSGIYVDSSRITVAYGGDRYFAKPSATPFVTTGTFNPSQWSIFDQSGDAFPQIDTYTLLRAYSGVATLAYVAGRTGDQDGAAGTFAVDESDTTSADNDGTILVDALGRRWKRQGVTVTPEMFGAVGDGVADDTAAVSAAVRAAMSASGVLTWPAGEYNTTASIPALHGVNHVGGGYILRGSDRFAICGQSDEACKLYVATPHGDLVNSLVSLSDVTQETVSSYHPLGYGRGSHTKIVPTATNTGHAGSISTMPTSGTHFVFSTFLKADGYGRAYIRLYNGPDGATANNVRLTVNLYAKTITAQTTGTGWTYSAPTLTELHDGWFIVQVRVTHESALAQFGTAFSILDDSGSGVFAGDGVKSLLFSDLCVSYLGGFGNDGLSSLQPMATLDTAFYWLEKIGTSNASWTIQLNAATHKRKARLGFANETPDIPDLDPYNREGLQFKNAIIVAGADVGYNPPSTSAPVPTTLFDGRDAAAVGIAIRGAVSVVVKDIRFKDYNGSASSAGLSATDYTRLRCENVHATNCSYGISALRSSFLEVVGGIIDGQGTGTGIRALFNVNVAIGKQNAGNLNYGPTIRNCSLGMLLQEETSGHSDYVTYEDCSDAIRVSVNSRTNCSGSSFKRNVRCIRADGGSHVFWDSIQTYAGTADANTDVTVMQNYSGSFGGDRDTYSNSGLMTDVMTSAATVTGTTNSIAVLSKAIGAEQYKRGAAYSIVKPIIVKGEMWGTMSGTAGGKQVKVRWGSATVGSIIFSATDTGSWHASWTGYVNSAAVVEGVIRAFAHGSTTRVNFDTASVNLNAASTLAFEVQLTNPDDSVVVEGAFFEFWGG